MAGEPLFVQPVDGDPAITSTAQELRQLIKAVWPAEGIVTSSAFKVRQRGAGANFSVDVDAGQAVVAGDDVSNQGSYLCTSTATENVVVPAAPVSGTRIHRVVLRVKDKFNNGTWTGYQWAIEVLEDTGTGTPALPASAISLATVTVAAGQANVQDSHIADIRAQPGSGSVWSSYTPAFTSTGTPPSLGNGTAVGRYLQAGKTVHMQIAITFGSTSTFGTGNFRIGLPGAAASAMEQRLSASVYNSSSDEDMVGFGIIDASASVVKIKAPPTSSSDATSVDHDDPFTWATGDQIRLWGTYEGA